MSALGNQISHNNGAQREQTMEEILASIRKIIQSNEVVTHTAMSHAVDYDEHDEALDASFKAAQQSALQQQASRAVGSVSGLQAEMARLVSQSPQRRVAAAFDDLNTAFMKSKNMPVEGVAEEMLRPMLKDWLDNNLPNLVERLVREEISRIARGDI